MTTLTSLPKNLEYLQPFQEFLTKLPKNEIGDSTDTTQLEQLIRERVKGMTATEAGKKLIADLEALENYLSAPSRRNDRLHFVLGFFLIAVETPEKFLKQPVKQKVIVERLSMKLPSGAKLKLTQYSLTAIWKQEEFHALRLNMDDVFTRESRLANLAQTEPRLDGRPASKVEFGQVDGIKTSSITEFPIVWKRVDYLLKIPGGCVRAYIQSRKQFDEAFWESLLPTLCFVTPEV